MLPQAEKASCGKSPIPFIPMFMTLFSFIKGLWGLGFMGFHEPKILFMALWVLGFVWGCLEMVYLGLF